MTKWWDKFYREEQETVRAMKNAKVKSEQFEWRCLEIHSRSQGSYVDCLWLGKPLHRHTSYPAFSKVGIEAILPLSPSTKKLTNHS